VYDFILSGTVQLKYLTAGGYINIELSEPSSQLFHEQFSSVSINSVKTPGNMLKVLPFQNSS
jgi:hypothetical protein